MCVFITLHLGTVPVIFDVNMLICCTMCVCRPAGALDSVSVGFRVLGVAVGVASLHLSAVDSGGRVRTSSHRQLQVYPPFTLQPRSLALGTGSVRQVHTHTHTHTQIHTHRYTHTHTHTDTHTHTLTHTDISGINLVIKGLHVRTHTHLPSSIPVLPGEVGGGPSSPVQCGVFCE